VTLYRLHDRSSVPGEVEFFSLPVRRLPDLLPVVMVISRSVKLAANFHLVLRIISLGAYLCSFLTWALGSVTAENFTFALFLPNEYTANRRRMRRKLRRISGENRKI
jgi:hypothetical protein